MSFKRLVADRATNTLNGVVKIKDRMLAMGWTLHDDQSGEASPYYILKSYGEDSTSTLAPAYIQIGSLHTNFIEFSMYLYWNNITHTGLVSLGSYSSTYINSDDDDYFYLWVYGCKDWVAVVIKLGGTYYGSYISKMVNLLWDIKATLQSNSGTGTDKVLQLGSGESTNFIVGANTAIVCIDGTTGRQYGLTISDVDRYNDTITISSDISYDFPAGSIVGFQPFPWAVGLLSSATSNYILQGSGVSDYTTYSKMQRYILYSLCDPDEMINAYTLVPFYLNTGWNNALYHAMINTGISYIAFGLSYEDMVAVEKRDEGTVSSSSNNSVDSTGENWITNEFAGKAIIIISGSGLGQTRTILSNTNEQIIVDENWTSNPAVGDEFVIADKAYRYFYFAGEKVGLLENGETNT